MSQASAPPRVLGCLHPFILLELLAAGHVRRTLFPTHHSRPILHTPVPFLGALPLHWSIWSPRGSSEKLGELITTGSEICIRTQGLVKERWLDWGAISSTSSGATEREGLGSRLEGGNRFDPGCRGTNSRWQGQPFPAAHDARAGTLRSPKAGAISRAPCIHQKRVETVHERRSNCSWALAVEHDQWGCEPRSANQLAQGLLLRGPMVAPAGRWEKTDGLRSQQTRAAHASLRCPGRPLCRTMSAPTQVVNFGPGPAKLPRSVSPHGRAPGVWSEREPVLGWLCIFARGLRSLLPGRSPPNPLRQRARPVRDPSQVGFWENALGRRKLGNMVGQLPLAPTAGERLARRGSPAPRTCRLRGCAFSGPGPGRGAKQKALIAGFALRARQY